MAEITPTFLIHNMFKAQSSRVQRAHSPVPHTSNERLMGRRILPKRPIRITEAEFKANEAEILAKIREGRLAVTCPDQSFIDSLPDGRLLITYLNKPSEVEPVSNEFKAWPYKGAVGLKAPVASQEPEVTKSEPVVTEPVVDALSGVSTLEEVPVAEVESAVEEIEVAPSTEANTPPLENPNEVLIETVVPAVQEAASVESPKKGGKKGRKE